MKRNTDLRFEAVVYLGCIGQCMYFDAHIVDTTIGTCRS